ncbi:hypothetical protein GCM10018781_03820 [Kitasatospora indigofera]|uniref:DUF4190 domain-containing protein n=1 Tax=Kitasatospora indigofera TaxID=67307 RepID=A0A919KKJ0_9ACTN|nr:DUF4190 domain-containing protein [Kitasatospora indigofera]GHH59863.1 hypothetical protein GCM10018781_03820 [Kitasatospora indigofera]
MPDTTEEPSATAPGGRPPADPFAAPPADPLPAPPTDPFAAPPAGPAPTDASAPAAAGPAPTDPFAPPAAGPAPADPFAAPAHAHGAHGRPPGEPNGWPPPGLPGGPAARSWSGFAITSFVLGLLGFLFPLPVVSAGFAVAAVRRRKRRPQRGLGLAVAGLVFSAGWLLVTVAVVLLLALAAQDLRSGPARAADGRPASAGRAGPWYLRQGDCITEDLGVLAEEPDKVTVVPCDQPHRTQVYAVVTIPGGATHPGDVATSAAAGRLCTAREEQDGLDLSGLPTDASTSFHYPSAAGWLVLRDRQAQCFYASAALWTGSVRPAG